MFGLTGVKIMNLDELLKEVKDEKSFLDFIQALAEDFGNERELEIRNPSPPYSKGALGWENGSIDNMLSAAAAWGNSSSFSKSNKTAEQNPWYRCAHIIYAGKFYE
jgi:hypothetical protein